LPHKVFSIIQHSRTFLSLVNSTPKKPNMTWLTFALLTVLSWGVYGVILHKGRGYMPMGPETPHAGLKAFLFVCIAYAIIGIVSVLVLKARGTNWSFTSSGISWSLIAGVAGALGALTLVLALGAAATPIEKGGGGFGLAAAAAVMPIVFAGAPVVNTITAMFLHKPDRIPMPFIAGCILAVGGAFLVAKYAPSNTGGAAAKPAIEGAAKH
jgi:ABC-type Na+ efflux pump permease subunit